MVKLQLKTSRGEQRTIDLNQSVVKLGKAPTNHVVVDDENVSRTHAVLEVSANGETTLQDVGSASGTFVNGKQINKTVLQVGDEIRVGSASLQVLDLGDADAGIANLDNEHTVSDSRINSLVMAGAFASNAPSNAEPPQPPPPAPQQAPLAGLSANPFAAPVVGQSSVNSEAETQYSIMATGPAVASDEVETHEAAIEVVVLWGDSSVLQVSHLNPVRGFVVGEGDPNAPINQPSHVDYLMGHETLGVDRWPLLEETGGNVAVVVPSGATVEVTSNERRQTLNDLRASGLLSTSGMMSGADQFVLPPAATVKVSFKGFTFVVRPVRAGRPVGLAEVPLTDWKSHVWTGVSLLFHIAVLLLFYFLPPRPSSLSLDLLNADSRLVQYLMEPPELEEEKQLDWMNGSNEQQGGTGKRHKDEEGAMGKEDSKKTKNKYGIQGPKDNKDVHMAREQAKEEAKTAGVLGTLRQITGAWNSPTSPYGRDTALGADPMSALGALMGDQIGENFGYGGLGLRGTGRGGGGTGEGTIGLGNLGTIGHGSGTGTGSGYGRGAGGLHGRSSSVPSIRPGEVESFGSLSKEVIRRVVRRHLNEVRFCYEQELNSRPDLDGRVSVKFVISPTGSVQSSMVADSTLGNSRAEQCIAQAVRRWTFPSPEGGGIVVVTYPFMLAASGG